MEIKRKRRKISHFLSIVKAKHLIQVSIILIEWGCFWAGLRLMLVFIIDRPAVDFFDQLGHRSVFEIAKKKRNCEQMTADVDIRQRKATNSESSGWKMTETLVADSLSVYQQTVYSTNRFSSGFDYQVSISRCSCWAWMTWLSCSKRLSNQISVSLVDTWWWSW